MGTSKTLLMLSAVVVLAGCGQDPKAATQSVKKSVDTLNLAEQALHFVGLWPSYTCGDPAEVSAAQVAEHVKERIGCGVVATEHDGTSDSVVLSFPEACEVNGKALTGKARLKFSQGDDRVDARFDLEELKVDGAPVPLSVSVNQCGDQLTYQVQGSGTFDHGHVFALDLTATVRAGIPLIGHDDLILDGAGELDLDQGQDAVRFEQVQMELGDPLPKHGALEIDTADGHKVRAIFVDSWPLSHAKVTVDEEQPVDVPL